MRVRCAVATVKWRQNISCCSTCSVTLPSWVLSTHFHRNWRTSAIEFAISAISSASALLTWPQQLLQLSKLTSTVLCSIKRKEWCAAILLLTTHVTIAATVSESSHLLLLSLMVLRWHKSYYFENTEKSGKSPGLLATVLLKCSLE